jgi:hypothetical protein
MIPNKNTNRPQFQTADSKSAATGACLILIPAHEYITDVNSRRRNYDVPLSALTVDFWTATRRLVGAFKSQLSLYFYRKTGKQDYDWFIHELGNEIRLDGFFSLYVIALSRLCSPEGVERCVVLYPVLI